MALQESLGLQNNIGDEVGGDIYKFLLFFFFSYLTYFLYSSLFYSSILVMFHFAELSQKSRLRSPISWSGLIDVFKQQINCQGLKISCTRRSRQTSNLIERDHARVKFSFLFYVVKNCICTRILLEYTRYNIIFYLNIGLISFIIIFIRSFTRICWSAVLYSCRYYKFWIVVVYRSAIVKITREIFFRVLSYTIYFYSRLFSH